MVIRSYHDEPAIDLHGAHVFGQLDSVPHEFEVERSLVVESLGLLGFAEQLQRLLKTNVGLDHGDHQTLRSN